MPHAAVTAKYPGTVATVADFGVFTNDEDAGLVGQVTAVQTVVPVDDATPFAVGMHYVLRGVNGLEITRITAVQVSPPQVTVLRAQDGTVAVAHNLGERGIVGAVVAKTVNQLVAEVIAIQTAFGPLGAGATIGLLQTALEGANIFVGTPYVNKGLSLKADNGGDNNTIGLINLIATNAFDRPAIVHYDHTGLAQAVVMFHHTNFSDGSLHKAYEVKTKDASGANYRTRLSLTSDTDEAIVTHDYSKEVSINNEIGATLTGSYKVRVGDPALSQATTVLTLAGLYSDAVAMDSIVSLDVGTLTATKNATIRLFRGTSTTGSRTLQIFKGNGTPTLAADFSSGTGDLRIGGVFSFRGATGTDLSTGFAGILTHNNSATRTWSFQNAPGTVPLLEVANAWTQPQTITAASGTILTLTTTGALVSDIALINYLGRAFTGYDGSTGNAGLQLVAGSAKGIYFRVNGAAVGSPTLSISSAGDISLSAFTTGSIPFFGASGVISQDNANLFWDDTNNRLGIGLAVPLVRLHVTHGAAGTVDGIVVNHTDNTNAGSHSIIQIQTAGASGGDPALAWVIAGLKTWTAGIDNSDSDAWILSESTTLGTSNRIRLAAGGNLDIVTGALLIGATTVFEADRDIAINLTPNADNTLTNGTTARRWASAHALSFEVRAAASDANPTLRASLAALAFGPGGATALDAFVERVVPTSNKLIHLGAASGGATGVWIDTTAPGIILRSPDNNYWRATIDNAGVIVTTSIGASLP